jgi:hypothetical protein
MSSAAVGEPVPNLFLGGSVHQEQLLRHTIRSEIKELMAISQEAIDNMKATIEALQSDRVADSLKNSTSDAPSATTQQSKDRDCCNRRGSTLEGELFPCLVSFGDSTI